MIADQYLALNVIQAAAPQRPAGYLEFIANLGVPVTVEGALSGYMLSPDQIAAIRAFSKGEAEPLKRIREHTPDTEETTRWKAAAKDFAAGKPFPEAQDLHNAMVAAIKAAESEGCGSCGVSSIRSNFIAKLQVLWKTHYSSSSAN